jgi:hypothetical protein
VEESYDRVMVESRWVLSRGDRLPARETISGMAQPRLERGHGKMFGTEATTETLCRLQYRPQHLWQRIEYPTRRA